MESSYDKGRVLEVLDQGTTVDELTGQTLPYQTVKLELADGSVEVVKYGGMVALEEEQLVQAGETVVVYGNQIVDHYRLDGVVIMAVIFAAVVIAATRWRGVGALVGVAASLAVLVWWLVPQLLQTDYPLLITFFTLAGLAAITFYLGHGFRSQTTLALLSTIVCLGLALLAANGATWLLELSGTGSEASVSLKYGYGLDVQLRSLLLAGLLIASLGVLDDVTTAQAQAVTELHHTNPGLSRRDLFSKAFRIGREHIVALVNTLVLVYAGAALPAFLILTKLTSQPLWVSLNSETIVEELVHMLVGSATLVIAVPLTTLVAAWWVSGEHRRPT